MADVVAAVAAAGVVADPHIFELIRVIVASELFPAGDDAAAAAALPNCTCCWPCVELPFQPMLAVGRDIVVF